ncbi:metal-dependent transcriptional regulator [Gordonia desulfuricans]|uniref:Manganese transport regulator n=1 Tax=Gordonia desulfuricans TaxID=89051 RepID=A0A7K3LRN3_9ACTN|nr:MULTISPECIES: metal-dependent transcriptional regulator [Gordonia]EMP13592.1 DtxR family transcriptional regulator [Gordonia sp. NB41Y]NDK90913.1 metal-dependent transcriptional regulator [Gordonia desulfuricans]WLP91149.1 metal-dependent transcriptional regulator [Gordonia sp. NB41Y]
MPSRGTSGARKEIPADGAVESLSTVTQDYLKVIWTSQEWAEVKVTTKLLADKMGVSASTASESIRKLADQGLVSHEPYGAVTLTDAGRTAAILMVRRHRLLETFLVRELGYGWDEVHDEAEVLEHAVSDRLMARLDAKLGHPDRDPHGDPIPALDGSVPSPAADSLADVEVGTSGTIARISDTDPEMLRYFDQVGVALDCTVTVIEKRPFAGTISITVNDAEPIDLGDIAARAIFLVAGA